MIPSLIVFDLDFTLWDCGGTWCDCLRPPFRKHGNQVQDSRGYHIQLYDEVPQVLDRCDELGISMALASRTKQPAWARELIRMLEVSDRFAEAEIYPSSKVRHFRALCAATNLRPESMLFFDDEMRNIVECAELGVTCVHVETGMSMQLLEQGLEAFRRCQ